MSTQKAYELKEEFTFLSEFIESGERPTAKFRMQIISLWGKMLAKLSEGPIPAKVKHESARATKIAQIPGVDEDGKMLPMTRIEHQADVALEKDVPGDIALYKSAKSLIEEFTNMIHFMELWLLETREVPVKQPLPDFASAKKEETEPAGPLGPGPEQDPSLIDPPAPKKRGRKPKIQVPAEEVTATETVAGAPFAPEKEVTATETVHGVPHGVPVVGEPTPPAEPEAPKPLSTFQKILNKTHAEVA